MHNVFMILKVMLDNAECQFYEVEVRSGLFGGKTGNRIPELLKSLATSPKTTVHYCHRLRI